MIARIASVSKPILFKPIDTAISDTTPEKVKNILEMINELIAFINDFRFRDTYPFERDVELREKLVAYLQDKTIQEKLQKDVVTHWYCDKMTMDKAREKGEELKKLFEDFARYARFSHLTATELAVVSIAIQKLTVFMQCSQREVKDVIIQESIRFKLNELIESHQPAYICILKHLEVFNQGIELDDNDGSPRNDILLDLKKKLILLGVNMNWPALQPDISLMSAIPALPFDGINQVPTAKHFFESCQEAEENATKWKRAATTVIDKAGEWTGWCLNGAWTMTSTLVTTPIQLVNNGVGLTSRAVKDVVNSAIPSQIVKVLAVEKNKEAGWKMEEPEPEPEDRIDHVNALSCDLHQYIENMKKLVDRGAIVFQQGEELKRHKTKIRGAIDVLEKEKSGLYCFSLFTQRWIDLKNCKIKALEALLDAHDLEGLKAHAREQMTCEDKELILAGRASRTKILLEEMAGGEKPLPPESSRATIVT